MLNKNKNLKLKTIVKRANFRKHTHKNNYLNIFWHFEKQEIIYDVGIDQEVEFHEIEIRFFMRSKLFLFMRSKLGLNIWQIWSGGRIFDHDIEIPKSIIRNFDLMIVLAANKSIMRSKFKINYINLVSCTCG